MATNATVADIRDRLMRVAKQWCELAKEREAFLRNASNSKQQH